MEKIKYTEKPKELLRTIGEFALARLREVNDSIVSVLDDVVEDYPDGE